MGAPHPSPTVPHLPCSDRDVGLLAIGSLEYRDIETGKHVAIFGGPLSLVTFPIIYVGAKRGSLPTKGARGGRILAIRQSQWVALALVIVGLSMMAITSLH